MKPSGAHTHPEMGGRGGQGWLLILGVIVLAAVAGPAVHALSDLIKVVAITMAAAVVMAVAGVTAVLTYRVRHTNTGALTQQGLRAPPAPQPPPIGRAPQVHLHFHGVSAEDVAAAIARQDEVCDLPGSISEAGE